VCVHLVFLTGFGSQEEAGDGYAAQVFRTGLPTNDPINQMISFALNSTRHQRLFEIPEKLHFTHAAFFSACTIAAARSHLR